ncbi:RsmB/NOP family class I SAM-dependent RNA methyltransferase [uncultured Roseobacter sp.]|uniref:RsmB/NOP family class I SAM-dependent RNA methyltransferase n=1 Tax=uncultured Roseobacter sp. TaxID=114847 RepID=UPI00263653FC|nr:RsmB/NOP family class I SAM-dependent RNA methyltransferase [uncultured Roseobacter sp.]
MTPAARISAAINLVDRILDGELADRALAGWGRKNRYAGSKDRAAIADLVYDVLRRKRSLAALGGGETGRALLLGYVRDAGLAPDSLFGAGPYAPSELTDAERSNGRWPEANSSESADFPEWLWPDIQTSLGERAQQVAEQMRRRAPVHLRINLARLDRDSAIEELSSEGIVARSHALSPSAVEVIEGARKIKNAPSYLDGKIELQDASSQAVADMVPLETGEKLLDFCAGGGGKTLAIASRVEGVFFAHDVDQRRMKDLPARAARAEAIVNLLSGPEVKQKSPYDTILIDAPCTGSGSWRRDPQGKWLLTREKLRRILEIQQEILDQSAALVRSQGHLVYATCSLLECENDHQVDAFLSRHREYSLKTQKRFTPLDGGDGFYCAVLRRD